LDFGVCEHHIAPKQISIFLGHHLTATLHAMATATPTAPFPARALYAFAAQGGDELDFSEGQIISVISQQEEGWYLGEYVDDAGSIRVGVFPITFVEHYQPGEMSTVHEPQRNLPNCNLPRHTNLMTTIRDLNGQSLALTDVEQNAILPSSVKANVDKSSKKQQGREPGGTETDILFEDDETLKSWYRNLNLDSETTDGKEALNDQTPQRDSGVGLQAVEASSSTHGTLEQNTSNQAAQLKSILQQKYTPIQILWRLQIDLKLPRHYEFDLIDPQQSEFILEVERLEAIIDRNLLLKEIPSTLLQASWINRLETVIRSIGRSKERGSSQASPEVEQRCTNLVHNFVLLLNPNRNCIICGNEKSATRFGGKITDNCDHDTNTCKLCVQEWIGSQLLEKGWDSIKCSECSELLQHSEVLKHASSEVFQR
jgi:hypothetical protein